MAPAERVRGSFGFGVGSGHRAPRSARGENRSEKGLAQRYRQLRFRFEEQVRKLSKNHVVDSCQDCDISSSCRFCLSSREAVRLNELPEERTEVIGLTWGESTPDELKIEENSLDFILGEKTILCLFA